MHTTSASLLNDDDGLVATGAVGKVVSGRLLPSMLIFCGCVLMIDETMGVVLPAAPAVANDVMIEIVNATSRRRQRRCTKIVRR